MTSSIYKTIGKWTVSILGAATIASTALWFQRSGHFEKAVDEAAIMTSCLVRAQAMGRTNDFFTSYYNYTNGSLVTWHTQQWLYGSLPSSTSNLPSGYVWVYPGDGTTNLTWPTTSSTNCIGVLTNIVGLYPTIQRYADYYRASCLPANGNTHWLLPADSWFSGSFDNHFGALSNYSLDGGGYSFNVPVSHGYLPVSLLSYTNWWSQRICKTNYQYWTQIGSNNCIQTQRWMYANYPTNFPDSNWTVVVESGVTNLHHSIWTDVMGYVGVTNADIGVGTMIFPFEDPIPQIGYDPFWMTYYTNWVPPAAYVSTQALNDVAKGLSVMQWQETVNIPITYTNAYHLYWNSYVCKCNSNGVYQSDDIGEVRFYQTPDDGIGTVQAASGDIWITNLFIARCYVTNANAFSYVYLYGHDFHNPGFTIPNLALSDNSQSYYRGYINKALFSFVIVTPASATFTNTTPYTMDHGRFWQGGLWSNPASTDQIFSVINPYILSTSTPPLSVNYPIWEYASSKFEWCYYVAGADDWTLQPSNSITRDAFDFTDGISNWHSFFTAQKEDMQANSGIWNPLLYGMGNYNDQLGIYGSFWYSPYGRFAPFIQCHLDMSGAGDPFTTWQFGNAR